MKVPCHKQHVVAVIQTPKGELFVGTNGVDNPQKTCPRELIESKTGENYHLCRDVCGQVGHAEAVACTLAGEKARGGTLYLFGHTYACKECLELMYSVGIRELCILSTENCWMRYSVRDLLY